MSEGTSWVREATDILVSACTKLPPFAERGGTAPLEDAAVIEVTVLIEMVVDLGVSGGELLQAETRMSVASRTHEVPSYKARPSNVTGLTL